MGSLSCQHRIASEQSPLKLSKEDPEWSPIEAVLAICEVSLPAQWIHTQDTNVQSLTTQQDGVEATGQLLTPARVSDKWAPRLAFFPPPPARLMAQTPTKPPPRKLQSKGSRYRLAIVLLLLLRPHLSFLVPSSFAAGRAPLKAAPRPKPYLGNPTARL
uniref:Uncharacterized protein n=1 Tax=Oryza rufipogon TaxID=4529 RepID=A0A0E0N4N8_ORYRU